MAGLLCESKCHLQHAMQNSHCQQCLVLQSQAAHRTIRWFRSLYHASTFDSRAKSEPHRAAADPLDEMGMVGWTCCWHPSHGLHKCG
jgi:hypothetical protein